MTKYRDKNGKILEVGPGLGGVWITLRGRHRVKSPALPPRATEAEARRDLDASGQRRENLRWSKTKKKAPHGAGGAEVKIDVGNPGILSRIPEEQDALFELQKKILKACDGYSFAQCCTVICRVLECLQLASVVSVPPMLVDEDSQTGADPAGS